MNIIFQQEPDETLRKPWPVVVDEQNRVISGRPDAKFLIGFAAVGNIYSVSVLPEEARADLSKVVGMTPVYSPAQKDGAMFTVDLPISDCREYKGDVIALAKLS